MSRRQPSANEEFARTFEDRPSWPRTDEVGWLVQGLVFSLRIFFVLFAAFARAVVIVAGENFPDALCEQVLPTAISANPAPTQTRGTSVDSIAQHAIAVSSQPQSYYVIFVGRQVGYTASSILMASLVQDVPNAFSQMFDTFEEMVQAYSVAVCLGNVRRVRTVILPSGNAEFLYDRVDRAAGLYNLDDPHMKPQPLTHGTFPSELLPPTPCNSTFTDALEEQAGTRVPSVSPLSTTSGSDDVARTDGWSMVSAPRASANSAIATVASACTKSANVLSRERDVTKSVMLLDGDEGSQNVSFIENNPYASAHSAHSSDIYYTDKKYDLAIAAFIEEEDNALKHLKSASEAAVQTE